MRARRILVLTALLAACSAGAASPNPDDSTTPLPTTAAAPTITEPVETTVAATATTATTSTPTLPTTTPAPSTTSGFIWTAVTAPGSYEAADLEIHIRFVSEVADVDSVELETLALSILNDADGWLGGGFGFVADGESELTVILAEGNRVDELCLPLETYGKVSCQNGPVVALNADRWRLAGDDWDGTIESYRRYLVNHEVGHLIGLRHPQDRCPTPSKVSALMEPQTNNLQDCVGNGSPLDWELQWAQRRPAVVGPDPAWDGPRPEWPLEG
jgi:hypothetical protein